MEELLGDPTVIGLILAVVGALGLAGGALRVGMLSLDIRTARGRVIILFALLMLSGLAIIAADLIGWWGE